MIYRVIDISEEFYSEELYNEAFCNMTKARQEKALRYKEPQDRRRCVFADYLLREMLKNFFDIDSPEIITDEKGKPHISGCSLFISISHSGDFVACAVDKSPIGIDLECPRKVTENLISYISTEEEKCYILGADKDTIDEETTFRFLEVWTAKEAYLKYTGEGLRGGIQSVKVADDKGLSSVLSTGQKLLSLREQGYILSIVYK